MANGPDTLDNVDVINMTNVALDSGIIMAAIVECPKVTFDLTVTGLIELAKAKVDPEVIRTMQRKASQQP